MLYWGWAVGCRAQRRDETPLPRRHPVPRQRSLDSLLPQRRPARQRRVAADHSRLKTRVRAVRVSRKTGRRRSSLPVTPSSRTSAERTTSSGPTRPRRRASLGRTPSRAARVRIPPQDPLCHRERCRPISAPAAGSKGGPLGSGDGVSHRAARSPENGDGAVATAPAPPARGLVLRVQLRDDHDRVAVPASRCQVSGTRRLWPGNMRFGSATWLRFASKMRGYSVASP